MQPGGGLSPFGRPWRNKSEYDTLTARGAPDVHGQLLGSARRSALVDVTGESIYEAAALAVSALKNSGWTDAIAQGTELDVQVREPATCHRLTLQQILRWCDGVAFSPDETLKKRRLRQLLA